MDTVRKIGVIGHKNPDTDSICSAIAYADLKNRTDGNRYESLRAGTLSGETEYVLRRFGHSAPDLCMDVSAQVQDIDIRMMPGVAGRMTVRRAWETMRDQQISTLPITDEEGRLLGIITLKDLAMANMDSLDTQFLANAHTPYENILETLEGTLITGDPKGFVQSGKIVVGAASPETMESVVDQGDLVIVANRYESQYCAIEMGAACIVVCTGSAVPKTIVRLAEKHGCAIISTAYDTYPAACLISQSVPIAFHMLRNNLLTFKLTDDLEAAKEVMSRVRFVYFPILDNDGKYVGVISRRNLLNLRRKQLILVDHNEKTQCVDGWEEAEILEIIDHHRIGNLETSGPVYFRNQPVGCTATVIFQMYQEADLTIAPDIAGLLLSAILSDTLKFQSPTCTPLDRRTAQTLAQIAGVDIDELATAMFEAGEALEGKSPQEIFQQDYKTFDAEKIHFGVGQGSFVSQVNYDKAKEMVSGYLQEALAKTGMDMVFYMLTSLPDQSTLVLSAGSGSEELLQKAFNAQRLGGGMLLPDVVSRKKQFIPQLLRAIQED